MTKTNLILMMIIYKIEQITENTKSQTNKRQNIKDKHIIKIWAKRPSNGQSVPQTDIKCPLSNC
jgi:hypothetical protein